MKKTNRVNYVNDILIELDYFKINSTVFGM